MEAARLSTSAPTLGDLGPITIAGQSLLVIVLGDGRILKGASIRQIRNSLERRIIESDDRKIESFRLPSKDYEPFANVSTSAHGFDGYDFASRSSLIS